MKIWKSVQYTFLVASFLAMLAAMLLTAWLATTDVHKITDSEHPVRHQYGPVTFFINQSQDTWITRFWIIFGACFVCGVIIALLRGDIRGQKR
ncbi:hypothetical protein [Pseudolabrys taiwanensis]|uniref:hypothetical protein n=1 Tax=Pseudolabrys taiwanensis TaxID=331696 RepID=UPI0013B4023E|nr:hypothetical protein [Pseudolabrys taiwanensis]